MRWSCGLLLAAVLAACGTEPDERPLTFEVVTLEVLKPTCGQVQCHSTTTWTHDRAFDTLSAAKYSLCDMAVPQSPQDNDLLYALHGTNDLERMPPDLPLAKEDEAFLVNWMNAGTPGLTCTP